MSYLFAILFLIALIGLLLGLIKPSFVSKIIGSNEGRKKVLLMLGFASLILFILTGLTGNSNQSSQSQETEIKSEQNDSQAIEQNEDIPTEIPSSEAESTEQILTDAANKVAKDTEPLILEEDGEWVVNKVIQSNAEIMQFSVAKALARDFIFNIYATKLPVKHVSIAINFPNGKYYKAGLGKDMAKTQSPETWTNKNVGETIFYDFLKEATNGSAGDGKNSTYIETNLD